jgi:decaprenylphospho-beta-D-ribofuranose 2-oxidase
MQGAPAGLDDIPHERANIASFTDLYEKKDVLVFVPTTEDEIARIFAYAGQHGHRVTLRAGGHAFDEQAMSDDLTPQKAEHFVVSMTSFSRISVDVAAAEMTVGAGTTWGSILQKLQPLGLVPFSTVTTAHATAGGTMAGDCLSRFSPALGKEGHHIKSFRIVTPKGDRLMCPRPVDPAHPASLEERVFCAAVGGLGFFGAVTEITYELLFVGQSNGKIGVESYVTKYDTFAELADVLIPLTRTVHEEHFLKLRPAAASTPTGVYSADYAAKGDHRALICTSRYTTSTDRIPMPQDQPGTALRVVVEWLMRVTWLTPVMWSVFFFVLKEKKRYVDDLEGFTFMMDGNTHAKEIAARFHIKLKAIQQTFVIPALSDTVEWSTARDRLVEFMDAAQKRFEVDGLIPTLFDVLFIPRDDRFLLSASAGLAGFAVSFAFETNDERVLGLVRTALHDLSDVCGRLEGRVYLVKNVNASKATIATMYQKTLPEFRALKALVDPERVLVNAYLEKVIG